MKIFFRTSNKKNYICAEDGGGPQGEVVFTGEAEQRPAGLVVADRTIVGEWEEIEPVHIQDDLYAFLSAGQYYLCAEQNGEDAGKIIANRVEIGKWETFKVIRYAEGVALQSMANGLHVCAEGGGGGEIVCDRESVGEWEILEPSDWSWLKPPTPVVVRPLVGIVRVAGDGWADDTGVRRILGCSFFPAIRIKRDNIDRYTLELDACAENGYQLVRTFRCVGSREGATDPRAVYWRGSGVHPLDWPDFDELFVGHLHDLKDRGMKNHTTTGDMAQTFPGGNGEIDFNIRCARLIKDNGLEDTVALFEIWNEGWQNNAYGDDPDRGVKIAKAVRAVLPNVMIGLSAPPSGEEPDGCLRWSPLQAAVNCLPLHGMREWQRMLERAFTMTYWSWEYPEGVQNVRRAVWQGEPVGDGEDVYMDIKNQTPHWKDYLFGLHWTFQMCGQAGIYFNGPSVLYKEPRTLGDEWGFANIPRLVARIPEDVSTWGRISHGNKGGTTPLDARKWDTSNNPGGVGRIDQVWNDHQLVAIIHSGRGPWRPWATKAMRGTALASDGSEFAFTAEAGQDLTGSWDHNRHVLGIIAEFV